MVWRKGIKITLLIVGVRLFGDARCSKDQPISSFRRGIPGLCRRTWLLIFLRGWRKLGSTLISLVNSIINLEVSSNAKRKYRKWEIDLSFRKFVGNGISLIGCEIEFYVAFPPLPSLGVLNLTVCCPV